MGFEGAGTVEKLGTGVHDFSAGDRVAFAFVGSSKLFVLGLHCCIATVSMATIEIFFRSITPKKLRTAREAHYAIFKISYGLSYFCWATLH